MKVTYSWLKELTGTSLSPHEIADRLTMLGLEVEDLYSTSAGFDKIVVGEIRQVAPIPGSDHLKSCQVYTGDQTLLVACGAPNVAVGQKVPVATPGAELPGGLQIKERKIFGIVSQGMICSEAELGLSDEAAGIMVLDHNIAPGRPLAEVINGENDFVLELSVTPNRPDCLGVIGVARELCLSEGNAGALKLPTWDFTAKSEENVPVGIEDPVGCPRYTARLIRGVKIGPSPAWLSRRLQAVGVRSISNVVDVTNYVMLETGQPLHAFDFDQLQDGRIVVRRARQGEKFITLDEKEHDLDEDALLICDGKRAVALAGIMGGLNSEVEEGTTNILLESAYFSPVVTRKTAKRLGIDTESGRRFERGVDPNGVDWASNRATALILELAGGEVASQLIDAYPEKIHPVQIEFRPAHCMHVIGCEIDSGRMQEIFTGLGCDVADCDGETWQVSAPTSRPDLQREIDLIEEVARVHGYNEIPDKVVDAVRLDRTEDAYLLFQENLRRLATAAGLSEFVTLSMISKPLAVPFVSQPEEVVALLNPLSEDLAVMRPSLLASLLSSVAYNLNRKQLSVRCFENGRAFRNDADGQRIIERTLFSGAITGAQFNQNWNLKPQPVSFFDLKGILDEILERLHITGIAYQRIELNFLEYGASVAVGDQALGFVGKASEALLKIYDIESDTYLFELDTERMYALAGKELRYQPPSPFPAAERDLAIVLQARHSAEDVRRIVRKSAGEELVSLEIFDVYTGEQVPPGHKSIAFSMQFQSETRTLRDEEVNARIDRIIAALQKELGAKLR